MNNFSFYLVLFCMFSSASFADTYYCSSGEIESENGISQIYYLKMTSDFNRQAGAVEVEGIFTHQQLGYLGKDCQVVSSRDDGSKDLNLNCTPYQSVGPIALTTSDSSGKRYLRYESDFGYWSGSNQYGSFFFEVPSAQTETYDVDVRLVDDPAEVLFRLYCSHADIG